MAPSDLDAASLADLQRQTGHRLLVGACDLEQAALQGVKDGLVYTLVSPEHWLKGYIAVRLLAQRAQSGRALPQGWWNPGELVVSQSNVDEVLARQQDEASRASWFRPRVQKQLADEAHYVKPLSAAL
jgi:ribose transport system substrate-binding protein